jgi:nicotinate-nucleotide adenylyltransferase
MGSESAPVKRIGILGGTFDPPHYGHLILAELAADSLNLDRVLFVPAADPPHKGALRSSAEHRVALVERAIAGNPRFALSRVDLDRPGPHYSVEMVRLLQAEYPDATLIFLIGGDSLRDLPGWSRPDELIRLVRLGVMRRPGSAPDLTQLEREIPGIRERVDWIDAPQIEISASALAQRVRAGLSIRYQTPDAVRAYIEEHRLYHTNVKTVTEP